SVRTSPISTDLPEMVETRAADYVRHFEACGHRQYDIFHAQDGISGNALATLKMRNLIRHFVRTVHHVDEFKDPRLATLEDRAIQIADSLFVVSRTWQGYLQDRYNRPSTPVGNGVDMARYSPTKDGSENKLRRRLGLRAGPIFLAIGGIEERKNTIRILE